MNSSKNILALVIIFFTSVIPSFANEAEEDKLISKIIYAYEEALNGKSVENVLELFEQDGILVLQGSSTSIGVNEIEKFYVSIFKMIDFNIKFCIEEIVQMSPNWAFVRTITRSKNSTDSSEGGHEIFILRKNNDGDWKIARYAGSSAK